MSRHLLEREPRSPDFVDGVDHALVRVRLGSPKAGVGQAKAVGNLCRVALLQLGVKLLLEPHGEVTDSVKRMGDLLADLGHEQTVGICLDTGNSWLGGSEPLDFVKTFGKRIQHVHWKDMPEAWLPRRGKLFGCGMAVIPLGDGVVGIPAIVQALQKIGFAGTTTLEVAGAENVKTSAQRLCRWARG